MTMFSSSKQDIFYITDGEDIDVMIRINGEHETANIVAHQFSSWMLDSLPESPREILTRVDHFFGDGRYMRWTVKPSDLTMIKLAWKIKTREEWVAEYHKATRELMERIKSDMDVILSTGLMKQSESAYVNYLFKPEKSLCRITLPS